MDNVLADKIRNCPNLPSLPAVAVQVVELAQNIDADIVEIARVISKDPALSSKILKTVNSSFYGRGKNVSTISQALVILGLQSVRTLVLGFSLVSGLANKKSRAFPHLSFWKRSLFSATAAKMIAVKTACPDTEEAFLAALLMDIGMLALDLVLPDQYADVYGKAANHDGLCAAEREALQADHAEVAGLLCEHWKLPAVLQSPVANHHTPAAVSDVQQRQLTELIGIAGQCANVFIDEQTAASISEIQSKLQSIYNIPAADADTLLSEIGKKTKEMASLFEINIGPTEDFEAILKKASETLVKISLQTQARATVAPGRALKAALVAELLSAKAIEAFVAAQFDLAKEHRSTLSVLVLAVDEWESLRSGSGQGAVEAISQFVSRLVGAAARTNDRGGWIEANRWILAMPAADRGTAAALADTLRRAIAARPISVSPQPVLATLSIGVVTYQPGSPFRAAEHLIKAAELALANAQRSGKSCVKIFSLPVPPPAKAA